MLGFEEGVDVVDAEAQEVEEEEAPEEGSEVQELDVGIEEGGPGLRG